MSDRPEYMTWQEAWKAEAQRAEKAEAEVRELREALTTARALIGQLGKALVSLDEEYVEETDRHFHSDSIEGAALAAFRASEQRNNDG